MKILKTVVIDMEAPESTETAVTARMKHLDFNCQLNRRCNYKWGYKADRMDMDSADTPENALGTAGDVSMFVHPSARVYILIRGLVSYLSAEGGDPTSLRRPSYDYKISTTHRSFD